MTSITFDDLGLIEPLRRAVAAEGYTTPTPIQANSIPSLLLGRDLLGLAQTGTGKTAAFALPTLQRLQQNPHPRVPRSPRALILTPTRELAVQVNESFATYGKQMQFRRAVIFGGVPQGPQATMLGRGVDIVVATPGRLLDLMGQRLITLDRVEIFVLDEADRMLDMGFIHDVKKIAAVLPRRRQSLFFSATMPPIVADLANGLLTDPHRVEVNPTSSTVERIEQRVLFVEKEDKDALLEELLADGTIERALIFTRTKHRANRVVERLMKSKINADAIHGNKSQGARQRALNNFAAGKSRVLVATDIAARGIDIDGITHVINFELPNEPESYVHRIGRTARAGADGIAISFCDREERFLLKAIERVIKTEVVLDDSHSFHSEAVANISVKGPGPKMNFRRGGGGGGDRNRGGRPPFKGNAPSRERNDGPGRPAGHAPVHRDGAGQPRREQRNRAGQSRRAI
ncbi:MAG: DEAD/DEAH box helicase [Nitrospinae bacterium]|nr:DEAD/DEAH box helicase [Nitrospinota bacterium]